MLCLASWPSLVVLDLDHTCWNRPRFRAGPPFTPVNAGLAGITSASGETLDLYPGARRTLMRLRDAGVPVALASRSHRKNWALEWLRMLRVDGDTTFESVVSPSPILIRDGSKAEHVREIHRRTSVEFDEMLFFDDNVHDVARVEQLGCTVVHCAGGRGLTEALFDEGLARWQARPHTAAAVGDGRRGPGRRRRHRGGRA